ncbi:pyruvate carboxylase [Sporomusa acidovorans]|uniref:Pyruvate carboxylase n=1 Tax=Sporomusa acidovorans (strain ATCC 49682 / DSM 3132 / Mol) TaxID=1123286 RepID=A0ABZ3IZT0_SPOA4|nr:pyruvate carboxylase [Sporomusa acidovorans]OZC21967.1 2-oxoglutarate carboxylase small subunit [Sporomusa acidovorans DSM 3132]SDF65262.1 pyruvate carboxylase [Sporomusa acidovorans]
MKKIKTVLVANRGEIAIRVIRACYELGIHTIAIYSKEDIFSLHRYKADEAYLVGENKSPVDAYLDIEGIIKIAKAHGADAIHPGYGFLSENINLAKRCKEEEIIFIGPTIEHLAMFGDKINARTQAVAAGLPVIPGSNGPVHSVEDVKAFAANYGYPFIIKAILGGGGRGMRIVRSAAAIEESYLRAKSEAKASFGDDQIYLERLLEFPKHIEVQILGDQQGNVIHLYERDCSVQRRHQKVIEIAPSISLSDELRHEICNAAVKLMKTVGYVSAGTVEFLVTPDQQYYFIEVNPRVQVEHTITEMITGVDIVQAQLYIADGASLRDEGIGIPEQSYVACNGHAIQCRVTTEDPANQFMPDTGKITAYRSGGGFGVRLDAGNAYTGSVITPFYDSLLVKVSTSGLTHKSAIAKMKRCLGEFRIRGIKTNIPFLYNVVNHEDFLSGHYYTTFIDTSPELFVFPQPLDRGSKLLKYLAETTVNGFPGVPQHLKPSLPPVRLPQTPRGTLPHGTKQILDQQGPEGLIRWIKDQKEVLLTDTTFRDAHQSLLATRVRTRDMLNIISPTAHMLPNLFSLEMWGGATFDVAYRFLKEDPWKRLAALRTECPNILFQMLLRGSNAVGYTSYPDNVIRAFVKYSAEMGIDVFRIFDSLNWLEGMTVAIDAVRQAGKVAEVALCYAGNILDPSRPKYDLKYYVNMAKDIEKAGAHILCIKDMAGLLKPEAAYQLISALKDAVEIPVHLHMHDGSGNGIYAYARAIDAGVDIVDTAIASFAGMSSQPSANTLFHALEGHVRQPNTNIHNLNELSHYWEDVRAYYKDFESCLLFPNSEVYDHEMPGGQYSNLRQQAKSLGLENQWEKVKQVYRQVSDMFGDIIKVTPSSKIVGDMALYMVENNLTEDDIYDIGDTLSFPNSVVEFFSGNIGQPYQGFPKELQRIILKGKKPLTTRPGETLEAANFAEIRDSLTGVLQRPVTACDVLGHSLYPKVFLDWANFVNTYGDVSILDTVTFFYGLNIREEIRVDIEKGKTLVIKLVSIEDPLPDGTRIVNFELNGLPREVVVKDKNIKAVIVSRVKADKDNSNQIGASMSGKVIKVLVEKGDHVKKGEPLIVTEAMKMETTIQAPFDSVIKELYIKPQDPVETGDLLIELLKVAKA